MPTLILGAVAVVLLLWAINVVSKVDPRTGARALKVAGGLLALGFAAFLGLRGELAVAIPLGAFGLGLLGWAPFGTGSFSARTYGRISRLRSACLEMEIDIASGTMRGKFIAGRYRGTELERLDTKTLAGMLTEIDDESRALLVAYLDRRDARWREYAQEDTATGRRAASTGKMTKEEAYQILGLEAGAGTDAITRAHRTLMKKLHPDQGGTTYLAARVNEAKEILIRNHR